MVLKWTPYLEIWQSYGILKTSGWWTFVCKFWTKKLLSTGASIWAMFWVKSTTEWNKFGLIVKLRQFIWKCEKISLVSLSMLILQVYKISLWIEISLTTIARIPHKPHRPCHDVVARQRCMNSRMVPCFDFAFSLNQISFLRFLTW